jgi:hypothetical protein
MVTSGMVLRQDEAMQTVLFEVPTKFESKKKQGEWAEMVFEAFATRLGFTVSKPQSETRYDRITEDCGRMLRVQVKSVLALWNGAYKVKIESLNKRPYGADQIDFMVVYVIPEQAWYIIPVAALEGVETIMVRPNRVTSATEFEKYRECWHLLMSRRGIPGNGRRRPAPRKPRK